MHVITFGHVMPRIALAALASLVAALAGALAVPAPARAASTLLTPGVRYSTSVRFTSHGPVVVHVLRAPRPGGLWSLRPVLSNGALAGRERLTDMQRAVSAGATVAGVNGDFFNAADGDPNGIMMRNGVLESPPAPGRSSIGIEPTGALRVARISFFATWQGSGQRRPLRLNQPPVRGGVSLFTSSWGPTTPAVEGTVQAVIDPLPPLRPPAEVSGPVVAVAPAGSTAIPPGGAVLVARGNAAPILAAEAPVGQTVTIRPLLDPDWSSIPDAIGGGPVLVRRGRPVFRADEAFPAPQLLPRMARAAVGQTAKGAIVLVAVDGGLPGYSVGMTNFELGQTLVRLGAVTGSGLGTGGDTTMAFDGSLLNRPSDRSGERPISNALLVFYEGVHAPLPAVSVLSPNGDGVADRQALSYKLPRRATVTATLVGPDGAARLTETGERNQGVFSFPWAGTKSDGRPELEGRWVWRISALDELGRRSQAARAFTLNNTLGFLRTNGAFRIGRGRLVARFRLTRAARVTAELESSNGVLLRRFARRSLRRGAHAVSWNGRIGRRTRLYPGRYVVRIVARNALGRTELTSAVSARG
ncbi:MAG: phosphodiester glycosidase family protein [Actinomycetota bacterium]|nr:phosphodiester glycosidase family protein [Actinomycetota bacterium]